MRATARATARAAGRAAAPVVTKPSPTRLSLPGQRRRLGRVTLTQVVVVQLAVVAAVGTYPTPDAVFLPVLALAVGVIAAMFARRGGRWWYEDLLQRLRFRHRTRHAAADRLGAIAPELAVRDVTERGTRVGIGIDDSGWYAAVEVTTGNPRTDSDDGEVAQRPDLDALARTLTEVSAPVSAVQLVHHSVPVPTAVSSAGEWTWVAVRVDPRDAAWEAGSRGGGVEGVHRTIATAIGRVVKTLRAAGADSRVLTGSELLDALALVGGWSTEDSASGRSAPERWDAWPGADAEHVCFRLSGTVVLGELLDGLHHTSVQSATVAVRLALAGEPEWHGMLRIAAGFDLVQGTVEEAVATAGRVGGTLDRLDGAHTPAIYATAPTAWALR